MKQSTRYSKLAIPLLGFLFLFYLNSCKNKTKEKQTNIDTSQTSYDRGTIHISVDETFRPVIDQEIQMYEVTYPNTHIIAVYKPEVECFKDFQNDSTQLIIVARGLDTTEENHYKAAWGAVPRFRVVAFDAVAILVNKESPDSIFTYTQLQNLLTGTAHDKSVVMDGSKATSTVRYLIDSVLKGKNFGSDVVSANNTHGVLDAVAGNVNAVGFIGYSWFAAIQDSARSYYDSKLKTALIECKICPANTYARPSQENITNMEYPMFRPVVPIVKNSSGTLASGFFNFLESERGQLVFRRACLMPAVMSFNIRQVNLK